MSTLKVMRPTLLGVAIVRVIEELQSVAEFYDKLRDAPITKATRHEKRAARFKAENHATVMLCNAVNASLMTLGRKAFSLVRKGLLKEVSDVFDAAEEMVLAGDPEHFDGETIRIRALKKEVLALLRSLQ